MQTMTKDNSIWSDIVNELTWAEGELTEGNRATDESTKVHALYAKIENQLPETYWLIDGESTVTLNDAEVALLNDITEEM